MLDLLGTSKPGLGVAASSLAHGATTERLITGKALHFVDGAEEFRTLDIALDRGKTGTCPARQAMRPGSIELAGRGHLDRFP